MQDKSLEQKLSSTLRDSEGQVDADTLSALAEARKRALEASTARPARSPVEPWQGWLLAASVAVIAVLVALPGKQASNDVEQNTEVMALEEGPHEDPELFENLEFYEWLAGQEDLG